MQRGKELYSGKAKSVFETDDAQRLIMLFRDDTSAFDGVPALKSVGVMTDTDNTGTKVEAWYGDLVFSP